MNARGFIRDILDLADEQGWTARPKDHGFMLSPPRAIVRPGFEAVFIHDPKTDGHARKVLRDRLRKAGLKFHDEDTMATKPTITNATMSASEVRSGSLSVSQVHVNVVHPLVSPFTRLRAKVEVAFNALAEIEPLLAEAEAEHADMVKLREHMRSVFGK